MRNSYVIVGTGLLLGLVLASAALPFLPEKFASDATVLVRRPRIADPINDNQATRDRWIWARDGLAVKEELLSDSFLAEQSGLTKELVARFKAASAADAIDAKANLLASLRANIKIQYTGGDSNSFQVQVIDRDAKTAAALAGSMVERIEYLYVGNVLEGYASALEKTKEEMRRLAEMPSTKDATESSVRAVRKTALEQTYQHLTTAQLVHEVEGDQLVQTVIKPVPASSPFWPNKPFIIVLGGFAGFVLGLLIQFLRTIKK
jgi:hypothetical protein